MEFMVPFIDDKTKWPFAHDVEHWDDFPVRNPALLFAGLAYDQPGYITVWKRLDPDPTVPEVIRNFPIRQPLLWVSPLRQNRCRREDLRGGMSFSCVATLLLATR